MVESRAQLGRRKSATAQGSVPATPEFLRATALAWRDNGSPPVRVPIGSRRAGFSPVLPPPRQLLQAAAAHTRDSTRLPSPGSGAQRSDGASSTATEGLRRALEVAGYSGVGHFACWQCAWLTAAVAASVVIALALSFGVPQQVEDFEALMGISALAGVAAIGSLWCLIHCRAASRVRAALGHTGGQAEAGPSVSQAANGTPGAEDRLHALEGRALPGPDTGPAQVLEQYEVRVAGSARRSPTGRAAYGRRQSQSTNVSTPHAAGAAGLAWLTPDSPRMDFDL